MSQKSKKTNASPDVVEGEIIDGPSPAASAGAPVKKRGYGKYVSLLVVVVALGISGWFGLPFVKGGLSSVFPSFFAETKTEVKQDTTQEEALVVENQFSAEDAFDELNTANAALVSRVAMLEDRLLTLEQAPDPVQDPSLDLVVAAVDSNLLERIASLEQSMSNIVANPVAVDPVVAPTTAPDLTPLIERIESLEAAKLEAEATPTPSPVAVVATAAPEASYFMSLVTLSRAVTSGRAYQAQILELEAYAAANEIADQALFDQQLHLLKPHSEKGVPTDKDIVASFRDVSKLAMVAEVAGAAADLSWWQRPWSSVKGLVTIRQQGEVAGDDIAALLARAEVRIERGNYGEAQEILLGTTLLEQQALAPLMALLDAKVASQNAVSVLITQGLQGQVQ
ncbi:MAG: hypothetical protein KAR62_03650 [Sphingomonadales bacterium]|nr:hypothetical protein [Sphingomonadales bacterium]